MTNQILSWNISEMNRFGTPYTPNRVLRYYSEHRRDESIDNIPRQRNVKILKKFDTGLERSGHPTWHETYEYQRTLVDRTNTSGA